MNSVLNYERVGKLWKRQEKLKEPTVKNDNWNFIKDFVKTLKDFKNKELEKEVEGSERIRVIESL